MAATFRLLARLWIREVDLTTLRELAAAPLRDAFLAAGGSLPDEIDETTIERLATDYCQLFVGPSGHLPPLQSVWAAGRLHGNAADSMQQFLSVAGHETPDSPGLVDHLGVQLDVMATLLDAVSEVGAPEDADLLHDLTATFLARHLSWTDPLLDAAEQQAGTDFYRSLTLMTRSFLESERASRLRTESS